MEATFIDGKSSFKVNQEALEIIQEIEGELAVVAVCGQQLTGKSYLINLLL